MASTRNETKWIVVGGALVLVAVAAIVVLTLSVLDGRDGTEEVGSTTSTSTSTSVSVVPTTPSTPTPPSEPDDIVVEQVSVPAGLLERSYTVISPKDAPPGAELPVVVALHGLGVDAAAMSTAADWRGAVAEYDFIAVFPQGMANSWNVGPCCPPSNLVGTDDAAFLGQVIDQVLSRGDTDAERLYLTGFSNGALMTYSYACANPGMFAAVAPMSGSNVTGCSPSEPLSLLHQHSDPDLVVPFNGGLALGVLVSSAPFPDVPGSVAEWAAADGCEAEPERTVAEDGVERWVWGECSAGTTVELVKIPGVGHVWPRTATYDGLDELLRFFDLA